MIPLSIEDIRRTAQTTVSVLEEAGFASCLVGSCANSEHGVTRIPNDIDILVLTDGVSAEQLKILITQNNRCFHLTRPADNPHAAYQVLWYTFSPTSQKGVPKICRVDVLIPGVINLPLIPPDLVVYSGASGLPVMPLVAVLLHKVLAWRAHGESPKQRAQDKQIVDVGDVGELLELASASGSTLADQGWLPQWFIDTAVGAVAQYVQIYPATVTRWARILGQECEHTTFHA
ncbi:hypothetical protein Hypma_015950 [Hypsizygus marmoreus]|uniref:Uncharacterized protein n=1 Tax=Hypsizygus marmoreus TaxID=39966 RepID=A0A369K446_HYPMA|nr:hypothetical protein Hypma_015950 [Hypsizygus marmoreus]